MIMVTLRAIDDVIRALDSSGQIRPPSALATEEGTASRDSTGQARARNCAGNASN
jgi:hypothetical protein